MQPGDPAPQSGVRSAQKEIVPDAEEQKVGEVMDPNEAADLVASFVDAQDGDGTPVTFSRIVDTSTYPPTRTFTTVSAAVHNYSAREIVNGLVQGDTNLVIQGDALSALTQGLGSPPTHGDTVNYAGFSRTVQSAAPLMMGGRAVRIDVLVRG